MYCYKCGIENADTVYYCSGCGTMIQVPPPTEAPPPPIQPQYDAGLMMVLPIGRSPLSIIAGYLGLFAVTLVMAPIALIVSIFAILDLKKHPGQAGMGRAVFGLVMGILGTLLLLAVIIGATSGH